jgi:hypothetical protein
LDPSVAHPPFPLQEFLPLQPLSLDLHPPLPLQEFWPLQACFSGCGWSCPFMLTALTPVLLWFWFAVWAFSVALEPVIKPASAAPANNAFIELVILVAPFVD